VKREVVSLPGQSASLPLSPGIKVGNLLFTSGQVGVDREKGITPEDIRDQTRACFRNLRQILNAAGVDYEDVVKVNVYLTDMSEFSAMNEAYREHFPEEPPARTTVGIKALARPEFRVEIEMVALLGG